MSQQRRISLAALARLPDRDITLCFRVSTVTVPLLLACLAAFFFLWRLGDGAFYSYDEATYARIAAEIFKTHDLNTLHWNGAPFYLKPPLFIWEIAASYRIFGATEFAARFPAALAGVGVVLLTYGFAVRVFDRRTGAISALLLLTVSNRVYSHGFNLVSLGRMAMMDLPLIVVITASFLMLWLGRKKPAWLLWMGVPLGLGVMIKGAMGLPPYLVIALFVMLTWRRRAWPGRELLLGLALSALIALPWHVGQALLHGRAFFDDFLVRQVVARVTTVIDNPLHVGDYFYYLWVIQEGFPVWWLGIILGAAYGLYRIVREGDEVFLLLFLWVLVELVGLGVTRTKIKWYIIPTYPALALIAARGLLLVFRRQLGLLVLVVAIALVGFRLPSPRDGDPAAKAVATCARYASAATDRVLLLMPTENAVLALGGQRGAAWVSPANIVPSAVFYADRVVDAKEVADQQSGRQALPAGRTFVITDAALWASLGVDGQVLCRASNLVLVTAQGSRGQ